MRWLIVLLALVVVWAVAEWFLQQRAEARVAEEVAARSSSVAAAEADIGPYPVVTRTLVTGQIPHVTVRFTELARSTIPFERLAIELEGLAVDRGALLTGRLEATGLEQGRFEALFDVGALPGPARAALATAGRVVEALGASFTEAGLALRLPVVGTVTLPLPSSAVPPCDPRVTVEGDVLAARCTFTQLPAGLRSGITSPADPGAG